MDDHNLSDESIDQIVRSTLAAQPAMDFVARVRTEIATAKSPAIFSRGGLALGVVTVAALVVIATMIRSSPPAPSLAPVMARAVPVAPLDAEPTATAPKSTAPTEEVSYARSATRNTTYKTKAAEILVPPDQAIALRELMRNLNNYELSFEDTPGSAFAEIQIPPLSIEPLVIDRPNEGAFQ